MQQLVCTTAHTKEYPHTNILYLHQKKSNTYRENTESLKLKKEIILTLGTIWTKMKDYFKKIEYGIKNLNTKYCISLFIYLVIHYFMYIIFLSLAYFM